VRFVFHKTISKLERVILTTLFSPVQKTLTIIILFMHLLSNSHKYMHPYYFPLLYKPATQKVKTNMKNSLMRSSRLALARLLSNGLWSLPLFCFARVILVLRGIIYVIIILYS
jgi:hypothetical protein